MDRAELKERFLERVADFVRRFYLEEADEFEVTTRNGSKYRIKVVVPVVRSVGEAAKLAVLEALPANTDQGITSNVIARKAKYELRYARRILKALKDDGRAECKARLWKRSS